MADSSPAFLVTRLLGVTSSVFLSGFVFSCSYLAIPALSLLPIPQQLAQWQKIYGFGKGFAPPVAASSFAFWSYAAYHSFSITGADGAEWKMFATAGVLSLSVIIWTVAIMIPTNNELMNRAKIARDVVEEEMGVFELESVKALERWNLMNYFRALLPLVGGVVGLVAALK